ncbi:MAG: hypothetical protein FD135_3630 [Comamonadaceae bacterium]|nr:MAG: hypothetical protein FD135_3630 [Comamonadaceae bacterium]
MTNRLEQLTDAASKVGSFAMTLGDPEMALQSLMSAYATIAMCHPELTEIAAVMAAKSAGVLLDMANSRKQATH